MFLNFPQGNVEVAELRKRAQSVVPGIYRLSAGEAQRAGPPGPEVFEGRVSSRDGAPLIEVGQL